MNVELIPAQVNEHIMLGLKTLQEIKDTPQVYVAGALNGKDSCEYIQNYARMLDYTIKIEELGLFTHCPGNDLIYGIKHGDVGYNRFLENNVKSLLSCDAMFICPYSENSKGVRIEYEIAAHQGIPVFKDLPNLKLWAEGMGL